MRNNKRQMIGAFVLAAMMSAAMPLSAAPKIKDNGRDKCTFMYGVLVLKASVPVHVQNLIISIFDCEESWGF
jgi:hypothetical protein